MALKAAMFLQVWCMMKILWVELVHFFETCDTPCK
jgi:hypothetical protein